MERLPMALPAGNASFHAFLRRRASANPAEKTWVCPICGTMMPREIKPGLYLRRSCACEERQREAREREMIRQQIQAEQRAQTFTWIGQEWVEPRLERLTFATFDRTRQPKPLSRPRHLLACPRERWRSPATMALAKPICWWQLPMPAVRPTSLVSMSRQ